MKQTGSNDGVALGMRSRRRRGFSLVELLVVVSIIALLMAIALPSTRKAIRQARETVCKSNLKEVFLALDMYRTEHQGWLPTVDGSAAFRTSEAWWTKLVGVDPAVKGVLICPDDPWASILRQNLARSTFGLEGTGSYGLNDFIVSSPDSFLANLGRFRPARPGDTILVADMGPDPLAQVQPVPGVIRPPSRNFGRLAIDDLYRPGEPMDQRVEPWLTGRHLGRINVLTLVGAVKVVPTNMALQRPISTYYGVCAAGDCTICLELGLPHYSFAESNAYWWTGKLPQP
jgi:prepilin-type N-terminal cleavage/methylation domain-containing protein